MTIATTVPYPLINGTRHEYAKVEIKVDGQIYMGVKSINYKNPTKPTKVYGTHSQAIGRTQGVSEPDADMELYVAEANQLITQMGAGYKLKVFDIVVSYEAPGLPLVTDEIIGCRIIDIEASNSQGADALTRKIPLDVMHVRYGGIDDLPNPLKGAATQ